MHMNSTQGVPAVASLALLLLAATGCSEGGASPTVTEEASYSPAQTPSATPVAAQKKAAQNQTSLSATGPGANAVTTRPAKKPITPRAKTATPANPDTFAIQLQPTTLELGQIPTNETVEGIVKLVNTGDEPMTVVDAKTSCGCTTANVPTGRTLQPGESADVTIKLSGRGRDGTLMNKTVTFRFEDSSQQQYSLTLKVKGTVFSYVRVSPDILDPELSAEGEIVLTSVDDVPFKITSMHPPLIETFPEEASTEHVLKISWDKWREQGQSRKLLFYLDHPQCERVYGNVKYVPTKRDPIATTAFKLDTAATRPTLTRPITTVLLTDQIRTGQIDSILKQINAGELDIETTDRSGKTILILAARHGQVRMIEALIEADADLGATDRANKTALMWACHSKNAEAVRVLLNAGSEVDALDRIGGTALCWAAIAGDAASVQLLVDAGADVNVAGAYTGFTPLIWAAGFGETGSVTAILGAGAELEATDQTPEGSTAIMHAARTGGVANVEALIAAGADLSATNRMGKTALHLAAEAAGGTPETMTTLIEAGADVNAKDNRQLTPLDLARKRTDRRAAAVIELLEKASSAGS